MFRLLWLIPAIPFASFIVLALVGSRISKKAGGRDRRCCDRCLQR